MQVVVLDTNVFVGDFLMHGAEFRVLLDGVGRVGGTRLAVPEAVVDETCTLYGERLREELSRIRTAHRDLSRLTGRELPLSLSVDVDEERARYRTQLIARLEGADGTVIPYPELPHQAVVARELSRRKPFKKGGAGYRDYIIWLSALSQLERAEDTLALVTKNTQDFGDGPRVHDDFLADLAAKDIEPDRVRVHTSLQAANDVLFRPHLRMLDDVRDRLNRRDFGPFDLHVWAASELASMLQEDRDLLRAACVGVEDGCSVWPTVSDVLASEVKTVRALRSGDLVVRARLELKLELSLTVSWRGYCRHDELRDLVGDGEPFDELWTELPADVTVDATLVLAARDHKVIEAELNEIAGDRSVVSFS